MPANGSGSGMRFNAWNLLLLIPLLWLLTPIYNHSGPAFIGMPFFYWFQLAGIFVAAICTTIVYLMTREPESPAAIDARSVDDLDEGSLR
jgi:hypothetical protein